RPKGRNERRHHRRCTRRRIARAGGRRGRCSDATLDSGWAYDAAADHGSERRPRIIPQQQCRERIVSAATTSSAAVIDGTATRREWWRREAVRKGSDWQTILAEYLALVGQVAGWPACDTCGVQPCVNQSLCAACRVADLEKARSIQSESHHRRTTPQ